MTNFNSFFIRVSILLLLLLSLSLFLIPFPLCPCETQQPQRNTIQLVLIILIIIIIIVLILLIIIRTLYYSLTHPHTVEDHQRFQNELSQLQKEIQAKDDIILRLTSQLRQVRKQL